MKKILLSPWLAIITFALLLTIKISNPFLVDAIKLKYYDYLMRGPAKQSEQIVIANISDKTIEKYGQYPFPRETYSKIINDLYLHRVGVIGNTIIFSEPDRFNTDKNLTATLKQHPIILSQTLSTQSKPNQNIRKTGVAIIGDGKTTQFLPNYPSVLNNISEFQDAAVGIGVTSTLPESDGVVRRVPLLSMSQGEYYPSFSMEMLRAISGDPSYQAKINETGVEALRIPSFNTIKTDEYSRVFVNWNYKFTQFDIGDKTPDLLNKIVILGVTASGVANPVATPVGAQFPQAVQASLLQTLINGDTVSIPNWAGILDYALLVVLALGIILLSKVRFSVVWIIALIGVYLYFPVYMFNHNHILIDVTFNALIAMILYLHIYTIKFISEFLQKQQIKKQFGTYLSPAMVEKLQKNPELLQLGGDSRELSIMFTDVRGFTTISEHYGKDVQGLTKIMNRYMTAMTKAILENNGTLDKYIGDAQMAFWNAPLSNQQHAKDAVKTAFEMMKALERFNDEITLEGVPAFGMGLGINTDTVVVGNMGSTQRFDYTCLGDGVNLASRLEGQSKPYGVKIIIGPKTAEYVRDEYQVVELDLIAVKGKTEPARIYTVLSSYDASGEKQHLRFLDSYRKGEWDSARTYASNMKKFWSGELNKYYTEMIDRIEEYAKNPPVNWDGVYRATSK